MAKGERVIATSRFIRDLIVARHRTAPDAHPGHSAGRRSRRFSIRTRCSADRVTRLVACVAAAGERTADSPAAGTADALERAGGADRGAGAAWFSATSAVFSSAPTRDASVTYAELINQAEALGVADRVRLVGECDDMPAALMLADVVVHASTRPEAFGRVVIEAQAMARPVIASDLGGPVETVEHGVTGWRVPPGDAGILAEAIEAVLALPEEDRAALGQRAREVGAARLYGCRHAGGDAGAVPGGVARAYYFTGGGAGSRHR